MEDYYSKNEIGVIRRVKPIPKYSHNDVNKNDQFTSTYKKDL